MKNFNTFRILLVCSLFTLTLSVSQAQIYTISGIAYLDYNDNQILDGKDFLHAALTVVAYSDVNGNGMIEEGTDLLIGSAVTALNGIYSIDIDHSKGIPFDDYLVTILETDLVPGSKRNVIQIPAANAPNTDVFFLGEPVLCYTVADGGVDQLMYMNRISGTNTFSGINLGATEIETAAFAPGGKQLFAIDKETLGVIDINTGVFMGKPNPIGNITGANGVQTVDDADGMTFDPFTGILYGVGRDDMAQDYLFQIDTASGQAVKDAFGPGLDYVLIDGIGLNPDVDDIAINPADGKLYGVNNDRAGGTNLDEFLIKINKQTGAATIVGTLNYTGAITGEAVTDIEGFGFTNFGLLIATTGNVGFYDTRDRMYEVDLATGNMTLIGDFQDPGTDFESCDCLIGASNLVSGKVYADENTDAQNNGEMGLGEGIKIKIYVDSDGDGMIGPNDILVDSVLTDANGNYSWTTATNVNLILEIDQNTLPAGYMSTDDAVENINLACCFGAVVDTNNDFGAFTQVFPVEWITFDAKYEKQSALLFWTTASEINSHYYEIERSFDARAFTAVDKVDAKGATSVISNYSFADQGIHRLGVNKLYYRLRQVDLDGTFGYSPIVELNIPSSAFGFEVYPNPVSGTLFIQNTLPDNPRMEVALIDLRGKTIRRDIIETSARLAWHVDGLPRGIYYLSIKEGEKVEYRKIMIE